MKRYKLMALVGLLGALLLLAGCSKEYLDTSPTQSLGEDKLDSKPEYVEMLLEGTHCYIYKGEWFSQAYNGVDNLHIVFDMMGEDVINSTTGNNWFIDEARWIRSGNERSALSYVPYRVFYRIIFNCNRGLEVIEKHKADEKLYNRVRGEFLGLRAYSYFMLAQIYGKRYDAATAGNDLGVVLRTTPEIDYEPKARSTVAETYAQINADIDASIECLSKSSLKKKNCIRLCTAYGLKARIALVQGRWDDAIAAADQAIATSGGKLQVGKDLLDGFNDLDASEWMWAYTQAEDQADYFGSFFAYMSWNFNSSNLRANPKVINKDLYETMGPNDIRRKWFDPAGKTKATPKHKPKPYQNLKFAAESTSSSFGDRLFMRLAEMYYIKAEAQARAGRDADAAQTLFTITKTRDEDYAAPSTNTGEALIEEIMTNRRIEFWGEGFRFLDLKRLNLPLDRTKASNTNQLVSEEMKVPAGDARWQFKIPKEEIDANPLCKQNP